MASITGCALDATAFAANAVATGVASPSAPDTDSDNVIFNDAFLSGAQKVDVSRFSKGTPLDPGRHFVDIYLNNNHVKSTKWRPGSSGVPLEKRETSTFCAPDRKA